MANKPTTIMSRANDHYLLNMLCRNVGGGDIFARD